MVDVKMIKSTMPAFGSNASPSKLMLKNSNPVKRRQGAESCRKVRKRRRMKNIINNIEKEIEEQLDMQSEKNDFITTNVLAILKEVIMDEDIKEMVRKTLNPGDSPRCYEPKLTRAKVRELLKLRPDLSLPILWPVPTRNNNFVSECLSLINENFSENSSEDEEYKPDEDDDDDDDKSEYADTWLLREYDHAESKKNLDDSFGSSGGVNPIGSYVHKLEIEENIGQRTRSKLPLTETPLEIIEQRFLPPDITIDMYETECDNEDWRDFIQGIAQPIERLNMENIDDTEDDPEYTIQLDEETVDREELREDKAVEVPFNEVEELIAELISENESSFSNKRTIETYVNQQTAICNESEISYEHVEGSVSVEVTKPKTHPTHCPSLSSSQKLLLEQQLRQHVQLTTFHFLQCYKHPTLFRFADEMKTNLISLQHLANFNKKSAFYATNLDDAIKLVCEWEKKHANVPKPRILNLFKKRKKCKNNTEFAPDLMKAVSKSNVFLYPLMLPSIPFDTVISRNVRRREILPSEEWLLVCGLQQFTEHIERSQTKRGGNAVNVLWESLKLVVHYLLPQFTPTFLYRLIKKRTEENNTNNYVKYYQKHNRAPILKHYIVPVSTKPVCQQPFELLPPIWETYIRKNFVVVAPTSHKITKNKTTSTR